MNSIKSLINLAKWKVDEVRLKLREAEGKAAEIHEKIVNLDRKLIDERAFLSEQETPFIGAYSSFTRATETYKNQLSSQLKDIEHKISILQDELREAFQELKKYEKLYHDAKEEERHLEEQREQEDADERSLWKTRNWG